jgi:predicted N-acetyltransferase YhbS
MIEYRALSRAEISKFAHLDRSETVDHIYYVRDTSLVLEKEHWDVPDWSSAEKQRRIAALQALYDTGATFFGAFDGPILAGMAVLDHNPVRSGVGRLNLAGLWVSCPYRNKGIGKALLRLAEQKARQQGARALYVSATPSENTVRFYSSAGCQRADPVDPHLFEQEPEDIHLELRL